MPRNVSGTYSLYTPGNPVVPSTVITTTWANNTLSDLASAMTDSLSRSGQGGMTAPLQLAAGLVGAPGLSWSAEPTSGLYRASAGNFRYAIGGVDVFTITSAGISGLGGNPTASVGLAAVNGTANTYMRSDGAPALSQSIAPTWTGVHTFNGATMAGSAVATWTGAHTFNGATLAGSAVATWTGSHTFNGAAIGGSAVGTWSAAHTFNAGATVNAASRNVASLGQSALSFGNTTDNPSYTFNGNGIALFGGVVRATVGSVGAPSFSFGGRTTDGLYSVAAGEVGMSISGVINARFRTNSFDLYHNSGVLNSQLQNGKAYLDPGSGAAPGYAFFTDATSGISLVSGRVCVSESGGTAFAIGYRDWPRQSSGFVRGQVLAVSTNQTLATTDMATGYVFYVYNDSASSILINQGGGVTLRLHGTATTGNRTLLQRGMATIWCASGSEAIVSGDVT